MKKKSIFNLILLIIMIMAFSLSAYAAENNYTDNVPYEFQIVPGTSEWGEFQTKQEMLDVCQIPTEKLQNMTTEALLETVMNYPLIHDYYAFNSAEDACNVMSNDFNGFKELFTREDVASVILNKYADTNVLSANEAEMATPKSFFEPATIEYLLVCNEIKNGKMTENNESRFEELHILKTSERDSAGIYSDQSEVYTTYQTNPLTKGAGDTWTAVSSGTVKTPKGNNVPQVYKRSPELTGSEKTNINNSLAASYPRATRVAEPTVKYNCHSYAWYQQSTSNPYWIGRDSAPSIYTTDGSYSKYSGTPRSGMKAWYNNGEHSGVSMGTKVEGGAQVHYVRSKWGMSGLYEHPYSYSPYTASVAWYTTN